MHTFQIKVLIQFFLSSTCFEHNAFVIRKIICTRSFIIVCFSCIYVSSLEGGRMCLIILKTARLLTQMHKNTPYKTACTNSLSDDERIMFETCRGQEELN